MGILRVRYHHGASKGTFISLRQLGFTDYQTRIYVQLLKLGRATAYEASKAAGVPRANAYAALETLAQRSAALCCRSMKNRYAMSPPGLIPVLRLSDRRRPSRGVRWT